VPGTAATLRFDLSAFASTVTREMVRARVRMTAQAFGVGPFPVPATLTPDGSALEVDAAVLLATNDEVRSRLESGPEAALALVRRLSAAQASLDAAARGVARPLAAGRLPGRPAFHAYVEASARHQALGSSKFCMPAGLGPALAARLGDPALVDPLLAPDGPTLWSVVRGRELALARLRLLGPAARYRQALARHRREYGYLGGEDVEFRDHETAEAIDRRVAALAAGEAPAVAAERRRLALALAADRAAKARARRAFAEGLAGGDGEATLVSHVLLARALAAHEDLNRRGKMRLLRDLRDLAGLGGLDLERAGLGDFAAACPARATVAPEATVVGGGQWTG
jgi:hypothetical protein